MELKKLLQLCFIIVIGLMIWTYDSERKADEFVKLRNQHLVTETQGIITNITKMYKRKGLQYVYEYSVQGIQFKDNFPLNKKYNKFPIGSFVKVIYLNEDPSKSRLVWTEEDFNWIE